MTSSIVNRRSVTFINNTEAAKLTTKKLDLHNCYTADEVVVKVHSAALNPMDFILHQLASIWIASKKLKTYGMDYAGEIIRRGDNVNTKFQVGDLVHGYISHAFDDKGTLSDYVIFNPSIQKTIALLNDFDYLDDEVHDKFNKFDINAAYPLVFATAYVGLFGNGQELGPNSKILVHGASTAVANCFVQIAKKHLKVGTVVGVCNSKSFEYNKKAGFDYLFAYDEPNLLNKIQDYVTNDIKSEKFDLIFDAAGTSRYYPIIHELMKPRNENSFYVSVSGKKKANYRAGIWDILKEYPFKDMILAKNPWRTYNYVHPFAKNDAKAMELASLMISRRQFVPPLDSVYNIENFQDAIDKLQGNQAKGKVIIRVG